MRQPGTSGGAADDGRGAVGENPRAFRVLYTRGDFMLK
jgi:hypothetical protein